MSRGTTRRPAPNVSRVEEDEDEVFFDGPLQQYLRDGQRHRLLLDDFEGGDGGDLLRNGGGVGSMPAVSPMSESTRTSRSPSSASSPSEDGRYGTHDERRAAPEARDGRHTHVHPVPAPTSHHQNHPSGGGGGSSAFKARQQQLLQQQLVRSSKRGGGGGDGNEKERGARRSDEGRQDSRPSSGGGHGVADVLSAIKAQASAQQQQQHQRPPPQQSEQRRSARHQDAEAPLSVQSRPRSPQPRPHSGGTRETSVEAAQRGRSQASSTASSTTLDYVKDFLRKHQYPADSLIPDGEGGIEVAIEALNSVILGSKATVVEMRSHRDEVPASVAVEATDASTVNGRASTSSHADATLVKTHDVLARHQELIEKQQTAIEALRKENVALAERVQTLEEKLRLGVQPPPPPSHGPALRPHGGPGGGGVGEVTTDPPHHRPKSPERRGPRPPPLNGRGASLDTVPGPVVSGRMISPTVGTSRGGVGGTDSGIVERSIADDYDFHRSVGAGDPHRTPYNRALQQSTAGSSMLWKSHETVVMGTPGPQEAPSHSYAAPHREGGDGAFGGVSQPAPPPDPPSQPSRSERHSMLPRSSSPFGSVSQPPPPPTSSYGGGSEQPWQQHPPPSSAPQQHGVDGPQPRLRSLQPRIMSPSRYY